MKQNRIILKMTLGYVMVFLLVACNSSGKQENDSIKVIDDARADAPDIASQKKLDESTHPNTIVISGMQFHPAELHIKKGYTVVWINQDIVVHDATEFPDKKWTSGSLTTGSSWKMKMAKSYDYFCSIHITMKGKIVVDP